MPWEMRFSSQFMLLLPLHDFHSRSSIGVWFFLKFQTHLSVYTTFINTMPPQRVRRRLTTEQLGRCIGMLDAGYSQRDVANALNVNQSVVNRTWNRQHTFGTAAHRHGGGRQRSTTQRQDHFVALRARCHPFWTATSLRNDLLNASGWMCPLRRYGIGFTMQVSTR